MAVYRDFDYPLRINGDVTIPSSYNLSVGGNVTVTGTINANQNSFIGDTTNGYLRIATGAQGIYLQATDVAKTGSKTLWLTGYSGATNTVRTFNNIMDDSTGEMKLTLDDRGITFYNGSGGRIFKKSGSGLKIQAHADTVGVAITNAAGTDHFVVKTDGTGMTYNNYTVYHAGNLSTSNFITNGSDQVTGTNFTVKGALFVGSTGSGATTGDLIIYNAGGNKTIHLDGDSSGKVDPTNVKSYIAGNGDANFAGTVTVNKLILTDTTKALVPNLNSELFNGKTELQFTKNETVRDTGGYGVYTGFEYSIFDGNTLTLAPAIGQTKSIVYTQSGRRKEFDSFNFPIPINGATSGDIYYVIYVKGPSQAATEGDVAYIGGVLNGGLPAIDSDAVRLYEVKRRPGSASISAADITDARAWKPVSYDQATATLNIKGSKLVVGGTISEAGELLTAKYPQLGKLAIPVDNSLYGRQTIRSTGTVASTPNNGNHYLKITDGTKMVSYTADEIVSSTDLWMGSATSRAIYFNGSVAVNTAGYLKASKNATSLNFTAGQTTKTWTHNYGNAQYAVNFSSDSSQRHIKWANKTANSIDILIDDGLDIACNIDVVIIPY